MIYSQICTKSDKSWKSNHVVSSSVGRSAVLSSLPNPLSSIAHNRCHRRCYNVFIYMYIYVSIQPHCDKDCSSTHDVAIAHNSVSFSSIQADVYCRRWSPVYVQANTHNFYLFIYFFKLVRHSQRFIK